MEDDEICLRVLNKLLRVVALTHPDLGVLLLCPHEHQPGVDLLQADEAAMTDIVQERHRLHILLNP